jgi:antitoxin component YwqK of YwqJK toxin-antitoxin module
MKKSILLYFAFLITVGSFAQQAQEQKFNPNTKLVDVVYYHDNGVVSQTGFFTADGKLQGKWLSFNTEGKKLTSANYDNGEKVGKWFFWTKESLKEVDYVNSKIVNVIEWDNESEIANSF